MAAEWDDLPPAPDLQNSQMFPFPAGGVLQCLEKCILINVIGTGTGTENAVLEPDESPDGGYPHTRAEHFSPVRRFWQMPEDPDHQIKGEFLLTCPRKR